MHLIRNHSPVSLLFLIATLTGCYSSVNSPEGKKSEVSLASLSESTALILLSNSTKQSDLLCMSANEVKLRLAIESGQRPSCREVSALKSGAKTGLTCQGGVNVVPFASSSAWVNCENVTLCGVSAASRRQIYRSNTGGTVTELTFQNLPWGCDVKVEMALNIEQRISPAVAFNSSIEVPNCRFCADTGTTTCLACQTVPPGSELKYGYVIKECAPGTCRSCTIGSKTLAHAEGLRMYSTSSGRLCDKTCELASLMRVCNDGVLEGDPTFNQVACLDQQCGCKHPASTIEYRSGQKVKTYKTARPSCPMQCEGQEVECKNGAWTDVANGALTIAPAALAAFPQANCTEPVCDCARVGRATVLNGSSQPVFNTNQVACGQTCEGSRRGSVSCRNGILSGDTGYLYDNCGPQTCGCPMPNGGFLALGTYGYVYKMGSTTCAARNACSLAENYAYIRCDAATSKLKHVSDSRDVDFGVYKFGSCSVPSCVCNHLGTSLTYGQTVDVFSKEVVGSAERCSDYKGSVTCSMTGELSGNTNTNIFKYYECQQAGQAGTGGGAGGGIGNGEGDGEFFKRRTDGGGGGGPCDIGPNQCFRFMVEFDRLGGGWCSLPWGGSMGPVNRGVITAFSRSCVVKPAKCSLYSQIRHCEAPDWTGSNTFNLPSCEEKDSCP